MSVVKFFEPDYPAASWTFEDNLFSGFSCLGGFGSIRLWV